MNFSDYARAIETVQTIPMLPAIRRHDDETLVLHALERNFKRPGVYKQPLGAFRFVLEWVCLCLILLCLMFALAMGTILSPTWHFTAPAPAQIQCVHVTMVTDDNVHWDAVRNYHC